MTLTLSIPNQQDLSPRITVFGVGGAGGNAVNNMIVKNLEGADFVVANTDAQALQQSSSSKKLQLGTKVTEGLGAGAKPELGTLAAEESIEQIIEILDGSHLCFITAGMGGGTGTGAAPVIAQAARQLGVLTVGVVTKPFQFEGSKRMKQAEIGIEALQKVVDTLIIIPNQNLFRLANENTTFTDAFSLADDVLYQGVKGITDLMVKPGLINLDFADVRSVMDEMGKAMMGTGEASGEDRATQASEKAIANPLLDEISLKGAKGVLINITGGNDLTLFELDEAANRIKSEVDLDANIIVGSTLDSSMDGFIRVSVVATGIEIEKKSDKEYSNENIEEEKDYRISQEENEISADNEDKRSVFNNNFSYSENENKDLSKGSELNENFENSEKSELFSKRVADLKISENAKKRLIEAVRKRPDNGFVASKSEKIGFNNERQIGGKFNNLIQRMTGTKDKPVVSKEELDNKKTIDKNNIETEKNDNQRSEDRDKDKLEIPAFLRRQAN